MKGYTNIEESKNVIQLIKKGNNKITTIIHQLIENAWEQTM